MSNPTKTVAFKTEVSQLLQLMIHSLYSNKEIFLRELISNAADAIDKLRFDALENASLYDGDSELKIRITADKEAKTLTIEDNGVGMNEEEVGNNLGTIARSGTKEFFSQLSGDQKKDAQLIGQFGVGFYSAFIVADKVTVETRRAGETGAVVWESSGSGDYTIGAIEKPTRGTKVTLHLKEGEDTARFLESYELRSLVRKYSDHIATPIEMHSEKWNEEKKEMEIGDWEAVNQAKALWTRAKSEISDEQYQEFYKSLSHDMTDAATYVHSKVEGRSEYSVLLYVPQTAPFDLWQRERQHGIKLYVKRVFIMEDTEQLLPLYLRFVRGVIDSEDLPLNVSREILQESRDVKVIREGATKKVLGMIEDLAKGDTYQSFWQQYGAVLKEGIGEDNNNKDRIIKLLRFATTNEATQSVSLADYIARMKHGQEKIYYLTADSYEAAKSSPHLEIFRKKGIEVLLLSDRVDEWMLSFLQEFEGKSLESVAKGGLDLGAMADEGEKEAQTKAEEESKDLVEKFKNVLGDKVEDVRVTLRLTDSPACLIAAENAMSAHLQRLLKSAGQDVPESKPVLEINPKHPLVAQLQTRDDITDWAWVLFEEAQLSEGAAVADPAQFVTRVNKLLEKGIIAGL